MSILSPVTWSQGAVQLVTPTTSALAALNSLQAAVIASTYWEQDVTGTSTLGYKYFVAKPKVSTNSIYADYRIFFCERVNYATNRKTGDNATVTTFNNANYITTFFSPDGGQFVFTPANIEGAGDLWPGTNYKFSPTVSIGWHTLIGPWTAFWLYEGDGILSIISRNSATSSGVLSLGALYHTSNATWQDENAAAVQTSLAGGWGRAGLANASLTSATLQAQSAGFGTFFWVKTLNVATRVWKGMNAGGFPFIATGTGVIDLLSGGITAKVNPMLTALPFVGLIAHDNNIANNMGHFIMRGHYLAGAMKTRTTIQAGTPAATVGYAYNTYDATDTGCICYLNG